MILLKISLADNSKEICVFFYEAKIQRHACISIVSKCIVGCSPNAIYIYDTGVISKA